MHPDVLSDLIITKVCFAATMFSVENAKNKRTNRERWSLSLKFEGETEFISNGKTYISDKNNIMILPKGCSYEWRCTKAGSFCFVEFECDKEYDGVFSLPLNNSEKVLRMIREIEHKRNLKKPMYETECIRDMYSVILMLAGTIEKKYVPSKKLDKIAPAINYIAENYKENIRNDDLAHICGLSTVYFRKLFTEVCGMSPISYIHETRIKKAKEMLRGDYGSITDIAESLGYLNIYDFSRDFKKYTGIAPSKY